MKARLVNAVCRTRCVYFYLGGQSLTFFKLLFCETLSCTPGKYFMTKKRQDATPKKEYAVAGGYAVARRYAVGRRYLKDTQRDL